MSTLLFEKKVIYYQLTSFSEANEIFFGSNLSKIAVVW